MNIRGQSVLQQLLLSLVFSIMFSMALHPPSVIAAETTIEEMVETLSKKNATEPAAGAVRMRSIGGNHQQPQASCNWPCSLIWAPPIFRRRAVNC
jgi:hypothetical protein